MPDNKKKKQKPVYDIIQDVNDTSFYSGPIAKVQKNIRSYLPEKELNTVLGGLDAGTRAQVDSLLNNTTLTDAELQQRNIPQLIQNKLKEAYTTSPEGKDVVGKLWKFSAEEEQRKANLPDYNPLVEEAASQIGQPVQKPAPSIMFSSMGSIGYGSRLGNVDPLLMDGRVTGRLSLENLMKQGLSNIDTQVNVRAGLLNKIRNKEDIFPSMAGNKFLTPFWQSAMGEMAPWWGEYYNPLTNPYNQAVIGYFFNPDGTRKITPEFDNVDSEIQSKIESEINGFKGILESTEGKVGSILGSITGMTPYFMGGMAMAKGMISGSGLLKGLLRSGTGWVIGSQPREIPNLVRGIEEEPDKVWEHVKEYGKQIGKSFGMGVGFGGLHLTSNIAGQTFNKLLKAVDLDNTTLTRRILAETLNGAFGTGLMGSAGYGLAKIEGADDRDAIINGGVFAFMHLLNPKLFNEATKNVKEVRESQKRPISEAEEGIMINTKKGKVWASKKDVDTVSDILKKTTYTEKTRLNSGQKQLPSKEYQNKKVQAKEIIINEAADNGTYVPEVNIDKITDIEKLETTREKYTKRAKQIDSQIKSSERSLQNLFNLKDKGVNEGQIASYEQSIGKINKQITKLQVQRNGFITDLGKITKKLENFLPTETREPEITDELPIATKDIKEAATNDAIREVAETKPQIPEVVEEFDFDNIKELLVNPQDTTPDTDVTGLDLDVLKEQLGIKPDKPVKIAPVQNNSIEEYYIPEEDITDIDQIDYDATTNFSKLHPQDEIETFRQRMEVLVKEGKSASNIFNQPLTKEYTIKGVKKKVSDIVMALTNLPFEEIQKNWILNGYEKQPEVIPTVKDKSQDLLQPIEEPPDFSDIPTPGTEQKPVQVLEGKMVFSYDRSKRTDVISSTTLEAIKKGERTATTRFEDDGNIDYWKKGKVGDIVNWKGNYGEIVKVRITKPLFKLSPDTSAEEWSKKEGWSPQYFKTKVLPKIDKAWQFEYELIPKEPKSPGIETPITSKPIQKIVTPIIPTEADKIMDRVYSKIREQSKVEVTPSDIKINSNGKSIILNSQQADVVKKSLEWLNDPNEKALTLAGPGGTGKTTIVKHIIEEASKKISIDQIGIGGLTNRAVFYLSQLVGNPNINAKTLHSYLGLQPDYKLEEFDINNVIFNKKKTATLKDYNFVIIDEASMMNKGLLAFVQDLQQKSARNTKIFYVGDPRQLPPVEKNKTNDGISPVFNQNLITLGKVERQAGTNPLLDILEHIGNNMLDNTGIKMLPKESKFNNNGEGLHYVTNYNEYISHIAQAFKSLGGEGAKGIAYTNAQADMDGNAVRSLLFGNNKDYGQIGEIFTSYKTVGNSKEQVGLYNSLDYIVTDNGETFEENGLKIKEVSLKSILTGEKLEMNMVLPGSDYRVFIKTAGPLLESARTAKPEDKGTKWRNYYGYINRYITTENIYDNGKLFHPAVLRPGYSSTIHKMQGATVNNIFVNAADILAKAKGSDPRNLMMKQLFYVGLSRASERAMVYDPTKPKTTWNVNFTNIHKIPEVKLTPITKTIQPIKPPPQEIVESTIKEETTKTDIIENNKESKESSIFGKNKSGDGDYERIAGYGYSQISKLLPSDLMGGGKLWLINYFKNNPTDFLVNDLTTRGKYQNKNAKEYWQSAVDYYKGLEPIKEVNIQADVAGDIGILQSIVTTSEPGTTGNAFGYPGVYNEIANNLSQITKEPYEPVNAKFSYMGKTKTGRVINNDSNIQEILGKAPTKILDTLGKFLSDGIIVIVNKGKQPAVFSNIYLKGLYKEVETSSRIKKEIVSGIRIESNNPKTFGSAQEVMDRYNQIYGGLEGNEFTLQIQAPGLKDTMPMTVSQFLDAFLFGKGLLYTPKNPLPAGADIAKMNRTFIKSDPKYKANEWVIHDELNRIFNNMVYMTEYAKIQAAFRNNSLKTPEELIVASKQVIISDFNKPVKYNTQMAKGDTPNISFEKVIKVLDRFGINQNGKVNGLPCFSIENNKVYMNTLVVDTKSLKDIETKDNEFLNEIKEDYLLKDGDNWLPKHDGQSRLVVYGDPVKGTSVRLADIFSEIVGSTGEMGKNIISQQGVLIKHTWTSFAPGNRLNKLMAEYNIGMVSPDDNSKYYKTAKKWVPGTPITAEHITKLDVTAIKDIFDPNKVNERTGGPLNYFTTITTPEYREILQGVWESEGFKEKTGKDNAMDYITNVIEDITTSNALEFNRLMDLFKNDKNQFIDALDTYAKDSKNSELQALLDKARKYPNLLNVNPRLVMGISQILKNGITDIFSAFTKGTSAKVSAFDKDKIIQGAYRYELTQDGKLDKQQIELEIARLFNDRQNKKTQAEIHKVIDRRLKRYLTDEGNDIRRNFVALPEQILTKFNLTVGQKILVGKLPTINGNNELGLEIAKIILNDTGTIISEKTNGRVGTDKDGDALAIQILKDDVLADLLYKAGEKISSKADIELNAATIAGSPELREMYAKKMIDNFGQEPSPIVPPGPNSEALSQAYKTAALDNRKIGESISLVKSITNMWLSDLKFKVNINGVIYDYSGNKSQIDEFFKYSRSLKEWWHDAIKNGPPGYELSPPNMLNSTWLNKKIGTSQIEHSDDLGKEILWKIRNTLMGDSNTLTYGKDSKGQVLTYFQQMELIDNYTKNIEKFRNGDALLFTEIVSGAVAEIKRKYDVDLKVNINEIAKSIATSFQCNYDKILTNIPMEALKGITKLQYNHELSISIQRSVAQTIEASLLNKLDKTERKIFETTALAGSQWGKYISDIPSPQIREQLTRANFPTEFRQEFNAIHALKGGETEVMAMLNIDKNRYDAMKNYIPKMRTIREEGHSMVIFPKGKALDNYINQNIGLAGLDKEIYGRLPEGESVVLKINELVKLGPKNKAELIDLNELRGSDQEIRKFFIDTPNGIKRMNLYESVTKPNMTIEQKEKILQELLYGEGINGFKLTGDPNTFSYILYNPDFGMTGVGITRYLQSSKIKDAPKLQQIFYNISQGQDQILAMENRVADKPPLTSADGGLDKTSTLKRVKMMLEEMKKEIGSVNASMFFPVGTLIELGMNAISRFSNPEGKIPKSRQDVRNAIDYIAKSSLQEAEVFTQKMVDDFKTEFPGIDQVDMLVDMVRDIKDTNITAAEYKYLAFSIAEMTSSFRKIFRQNKKQPGVVKNALTKMGSQAYFALWFGKPTSFKPGKEVIKSVEYVDIETGNISKIDYRAGQLNGLLTETEANKSVPWSPLHQTVYDISVGLKPIQTYTSLGKSLFEYMDLPKNNVDSVLLWNTLASGILDGRLNYRGGTVIVNGKEHRLLPWAEGEQTTLSQKISSLNGPMPHNITTSLNEITSELFTPQEISKIAKSFGTDEEGVKTAIKNSLKFKLYNEYYLPAYFQQAITTVNELDNEWKTLTGTGIEDIEEGVKTHLLRSIENYQNILRGDNFVPLMFDNEPARDDYVKKQIPEAIKNIKNIIDKFNDKTITSKDLITFYGNLTNKGYGQNGKYVNGKLYFQGSNNKWYVPTNTELYNRIVNKVVNRYFKGDINLFRKSLTNPSVLKTVIEDNFKDIGMGNPTAGVLGANKSGFKALFDEGSILYGLINDLQRLNDNPDKINKTYETFINHMEMVNNTVNNRLVNMIAKWAYHMNIVTGQPQIAKESVINVLTNASASKAVFKNTKPLGKVQTGDVIRTLVNGKYVSGVVKGMDKTKVTMGNLSHNNDDVTFDISNPAIYNKEVLTTSYNDALKNIAHTLAKIGVEISNDPDKNREALSKITNREDSAIMTMESIAAILSQAQSRAMLGFMRFFPYKLTDWFTFTPLLEQGWKHQLKYWKQLFTKKNETTAQKEVDAYAEDIAPGSSLYELIEGQTKKLSSFLDSARRVLGSKDTKDQFRKAGKDTGLRAIGDFFGDLWQRIGVWSHFGLGAIAEQKQSKVLSSLGGTNVQGVKEVKGDLKLLSDVIDLGLHAIWSANAELNVKGLFNAIGRNKSTIFRKPFETFITWRQNRGVAFINLVLTAFNQRLAGKFEKYQPGYKGKKRWLKDKNISIEDESGNTRFYKNKVYAEKNYAMLGAYLLLAGIVQDLARGGLTKNLLNEMFSDETTEDLHKFFLGLLTEDLGTGMSLKDTPLAVGVPVSYMGAPFQNALYEMTPAFLKIGKIFIDSKSFITRKNNQYRPEGISAIKDIVRQISPGAGYGIAATTLTDIIASYMVDNENKARYLANSALQDALQPWLSNPLKLKIVDPKTGNLKLSASKVKEILTTNLLKPGVPFGVLSDLREEAKKHGINKGDE